MTNKKTLYELRIRSYQKKDKDQIVEIFHSAYSALYTTENMLKQLEFALSQRNLIAFVAEHNTKLVGFIYGYELSKSRFSDLEISRPGNYLDNLAVKIRRKGIGRHLYRKYEKEARKQDMRSIVTWTEESNPAKYLYESEGFVSIKKGNKDSSSSILYLKQLWPGAFTNK